MSQAPVSEGIIDKRYGMTAMLLLKFMQQRGSHLFVVGMGDERNPLPRLLKAGGWSVQPVPFFFLVNRPNRFLRELKLLRNNPKRRLLAAIAAGTGTGWAAIQALHARGLLAQLATGDYTIEPLPAWDSWVDSIWERFRKHCSFGVARDQRTLAELYPDSDARLLRFSIRQKGRPVGWSVCFNTPMTDHNHFGNMRVATILDSIAEPGAEAATVTLTARVLKRERADLVVSNQTHLFWQDPFRRCGFRTAPSNYLLAMSPALAKAAGQDGGIHVTRGDGDGRIHL